MRSGLSAHALEDGEAEAAPPRRGVERAMGGRVPGARVRSGFAKGIPWPTDDVDEPRNRAPRRAPLLAPRAVPAARADRTLEGVPSGSTSGASRSRRPSGPSGARPPWTRPGRGSSNGTPPTRSGSSGETNLTWNCLDRHLGTARQNKAAIVWEGEPGERRTLTYRSSTRGLPLRARAPEAWGSARATASGSTCPWSPRSRSRCSPARGSARSTRSSSAGSRRRRSRTA